MDYRYLNHYIPPSSEGLSEAWKRVMGRLGDYTQLIVRSLNLRPTAVNLLGQTDVHLLVRLTTPATHLVLRIAPEDDMAAYVYFVRSASGQRIPAAQIIQRDLSRTLVPFAYSLESYVAGAPASTICEPHLLRGAARQAGRALRRLHRQGVPGFGAPNPAGRWPATRWPDVLRRIGHRLAPPPTDQLLFNEDEQAAVAAILSGPAVACRKPVLIHGAFGPQAVRCTTGEHIHLEALVNPGIIVGGDGLYDFACATRPCLTEPWREGFSEGYLTAGTLTPEEEVRLPALRLLSCYWNACYNYMRAVDHEPDQAEARRLLHELAPSFKASYAPPHQ